MAKVTARTTVRGFSLADMRSLAEDHFAVLGQGFEITEVDVWGDGEVAPDEARSWSATFTAEGDLPEAA